MNYIEEKVQTIKDAMSTRNYLKISTCDHYNWDTEYHHMFPQIAEKLRDEGYRVLSAVVYGVTDWLITKQEL